jgi:hypothetical protein
MMDQHKGGASAQPRLRRADDSDGRAAGAAGSPRPSCHLGEHAIILNLTLQSVCAGD